MTKTKRTFVIFILQAFYGYPLITQFNKSYTVAKETLEKRTFASVRIGFSVCVAARKRKIYKK